MRKKRKKKRKYTIECVLTSHSESCVAYLLIDERTGPIGTMQKLQIITNTDINIVIIYKYILRCRALSVMRGVVVVMCVVWMYMDISCYVFSI